MVKFSSSRWIAAALLVVGVVLGFAVRGLVSRGQHDDRPTTAVGEDSTGVWTCSMHPQIRMAHPGQCPICGMDLIPVAPEGAPADGAALASDVIALGDHARFMAQVETARVERRLLWNELRTVGRVTVDETAVAYITAWIDGRVDRVFADFPGTVVNRGDHLVQIYRTGMAREGTAKAGAAIVATITDPQSLDPPLVSQVATVPEAGPPASGTVRRVRSLVLVRDRRTHQRSETNARM